VEDLVVLVQVLTRKVLPDMEIADWELHKF